MRIANAWVTCQVRCISAGCPYRGQEVVVKVTPEVVGEHFLLLPTVPVCAGCWKQPYVMDSHHGYEEVPSGQR